jgi:biotin carboxylase
MGLHVVVSDADPKAMGFSQAHDCLIASTYDVDATVKAALGYHRQVRPIDGVLCLAVDVPQTVAAVAQELSLPGVSPAAAALATDKLAMKQRFLEDGVPIPWFSEVRSLAGLRELAQQKGLPLVLKPVDSRGARGVLKLTPAVDLEWAFNLSLSFSSSARLILEEYLEGPQISTESLVLDGAAYTPGFSDRNYEFLEAFAPHIIENGGELPSFLDSSIQNSVKEVVERAANSLGINNSVAKGDIVIHRGSPYVIEMAARLSGGYFCTHEIPLNTGVDFVGCAIRCALGEPVSPQELAPKFNRGVAQRYLFPPPGKVVSIKGVEAAQKMPGIEMCEIRVREGSTVAKADSHPARAGLVIAIADSRAEAVQRAVAAAATIEIKTGPM